MALPFTIKRQVEEINLICEANTFRDEVMVLARDRGVRVEVAVLAFADILGFQAARLDQEFDRYTIDDRLDSFCERVKETYEKVKGSKLS